MQKRHILAASAILGLIVSAAPSLAADKDTIVGTTYYNHQQRPLAESWGGVSEVTAIPEPSGLSLLGTTALAGMVFFPMRRRVKK